MKIIIVEDAKKIREELSTFLECYGFEVYAPDQFEHIVEDILGAKGHLILLDVNLPIYDGFYVCREVRAKSDIPIIVVTSRNSEMDELMSMNIGADDFVTKPYNTEILLAHINSLLKRTYQLGQKEELTVGNVSLNLGNWEVQCGEECTALTKNEALILKTLMEQDGAVVSRDELMDKLWQTDAFVDDNTLTVNVTRIRKKLEEIGAGDYIKTKRGVGYQICRLGDI